MAVQQNWAAGIATQCGVVPHILGTPGTAKTAFWRVLARSTERYFIQTILRQKMPEDIGGVPVPSDITLSKDDGTTYKMRGVEYLMGDDILRARHTKALWLLDELNQAGHDVLGAAQEVINDPPANAWVVALSNPVEQSTSGVELSPPVINRMCQLKWETPYDAIQEGWESGFLNYPDPKVPIVPPNYLLEFGQTWGKLMCEFRTRFPHLFSDDAFPKDPNKACEPWPSVRSFTNAGKVCAACDAVYATPRVRSELIYGCVGEGAGNDFLNYIGYRELPDPEDILARPDQFTLPKRFDKVRAIFGSVIGAIEENNTPERWEQGMDFIGSVYHDNPEASMAAEGPLWNVKPNKYVPKQRDGALKEMRDARLALA